MKHIFKIIIGVALLGCMAYATYYQNFIEYKIFNEYSMNFFSEIAIIFFFGIIQLFFSVTLRRKSNQVANVTTATRQ